MGESPGEVERREFVRIRVALPVRYAFTDMDGTRLPPGLSEGSTMNVGAGGLLLQGRIHDLAWVTDLLTQRKAVALSFSLPGEFRPVQVLARVAWIETIAPDNGRCNLGLRFKEMPREEQDRISRFVIRTQLGP